MKGEIPVRKKVIAAVEQHHMFAPGATVVVALSGGADSVALFHVLLTLEGYRLRLVAAHLNHCLRGEESDEDENFVRALCRQCHVPLMVKRSDVARCAVERGISVEEAGRECRYDFFNEVAAQSEAYTVALAHHADDQAETVLMRLLRGSGGTGLRGMAPRSHDGRYVRPLLEVRRKEIEAYLAEMGALFRTDSSNGDTSFLRNSIRHRLIPYLRSYNPAITERLNATAALLASDEELLEEITERLFQRYCIVGEVDVTIHLTGLSGEPKGARMRLYRLAVSRAKGNLRRIHHRHMLDIDRLVLDPKPNMILTLPDGMRIRKSYGTLTVTAENEAKEPEWETVIGGPGNYLLPGQFTLSVDVGGGSLPDGADCAVFDLEKAPFPWVVRNFRNGDRLHPAGMAGTKKVKELFMEKKVPPERRRRIPLLFCGETLLWVCGIRRAGYAAVTSATLASAVAWVRLEGA